MGDIPPLLIDSLQKYRHIGAKGTAIQMHRALRKLTLSPAILFAILVLPVFFDAVLWFNLENLMGLWKNIFTFCITTLALNGHVSYSVTHIFSHTIELPFPDLKTTLPTHIAIWGNIFISLIIFIVSYFISQKYLPCTCDSLTLRMKSYLSVRVL